jgi:hypothetical protein
MLTRKLTKIIGYGALYANSYYCGMKGGMKSGVWLGGGGGIRKGRVYTGNGDMIAYKPPFATDCKARI